MTVKGRRAEYAEATRAALVETARRLFIEQRYSDLSADEIARAARLTRGAVYHHFGGKQGLFEAVFEQVEQKLTERLTSAIVEPDNPSWDTAVHALNVFLDECTDAAYQRIVLQEGPLALGWDRWRELDERYMVGLIRDSVDRLIRADVFKPRSTELTVRAIYGLLTELAWSMADTSDRNTRREAGQIALDMIGSLRRTTE
ncbi:TetR/AcrR family transcriptional regulator [Nocardia beijingensis]|uniref:TetR/AcrR family transcriptional regulator n=1 Tax=Nocardia beijingensis TaxID=95162 RepID=UPI00189514F6|nr:TetR/AcrR family transcriptional regulator [Nocardia beijingensis]MBF6468283.1 TetR/AcrR family transcriptional regulator [Nocardia beijingensis]